MSIRASRVGSRRLSMRFRGVLRAAPAGRTSTVLMVAIVVLLCAVTGSLAWAQTSYPASPEMASNGVSTYTKETSGSGILVSLYDASASLVGFATVATTESGGILADWRGEDGMHVQLESISGGEVYRLTDVFDGETGEMVFNHQAAEWTISDGAARVIALNQVAVELAAASLDAGSPASTMGASPSGTRVSSDAEEPCEGGDCRGSGFSASKSYCCKEASGNASVCCTNSLCWGCCEWMTCDAMCAMGDYICSCGITGTSCGTREGAEDLHLHW